MSESSTPGTNKHGLSPVITPIAIPVGKTERNYSESSSLTLMSLQSILSPGEVPHNAFAEPESPTLPSTPTKEDFSSSSEERASPVRHTFSSNSSPTPVSNLNTTIAATPTRSINLAMSPASSYTSPPSSFKTTTMTRKTSTSDSFRDKFSTSERNGGKSHHHHRSSKKEDSGKLAHSRSRKKSIDEFSASVANVPPAPAPSMYWSRPGTYGKAPKPIRAHTSVMVGELMFVFGGSDHKGCFNALYILELDTFTWSKPRTHGDPPPPCRAHSATYYAKQRKIFVFGGGEGPVYYNDLYVLDTESLTWSIPTVSGESPSARRAHSTFVWNDKLYVFGGGDGAHALSDLFALDLMDPANLRWQNLLPAGQVPVPRGYHTANLVGDKLVVFGGSDGHECFSDVHVCDLTKNAWYTMELDRSIPRLSHTSTRVGSYLFVIGGHDGKQYSSDVLLLNLVTMSWETRSIHGIGPTPRGYHTVVLYDSRLILFGGYDGKSYFGDIHVLDLSACAYLPQITSFSIELSDD
ncbi:hypothetical protein K450DRAFT_219535 [Umbelopsis ramanniana AG]|uniref:Uncharacterized protein n=1 Tax=Umbelopsis ramanniana AG TaxID=1314678 RepID=A0AAD5HJJ1_UMBRA|nr:uncharacterized protein K450DRAFT_219535 [Umbelopsis ramanniana AG]KAI8584373.1 hypothetical protein K450DRAFT_219535 [Umbelopsis ramanniana AG]